MQTETKQAPEKKFRAGAISATVWKNPGKTGEYRTVQLTRSFRDKNDTWKTTSSFRINDLPKLSVVANKAYEFLVMNSDEKDLNEEEEPSSLL